MVLVSLFTYGVSTRYRRASSPAAALDPPCLDDTLDDSEVSEHDGRWSSNTYSNRWSYLNTGDPVDKNRCHKFEVDAEEHQHVDQQDPHHANFRNLGHAGSGVDVHKCTLATCNLCGHGMAEKGGVEFVRGKFRHLQRSDVDAWTFLQSFHRLIRPAPDDPPKPVLILL